MPGERPDGLPDDRDVERELGVRDVPEIVADGYEDCSRRLERAFRVQVGEQVGRGVNEEGADYRHPAYRFSLRKMKSLETIKTR